MIDIPCKTYFFSLLFNDATNTCCMNLAEVIITHQKLFLTCRELPTVALSYHVKIRKILRMFHVNKKTFCGCKPSKKQH